MLAPEEMSPNWDPLLDKNLSIWEVAVRLARSLLIDGLEKTAELNLNIGSRVEIDAVKELSYLLYSICEKKGWTESAILFNGLGTSWIDLHSVVAKFPSETPSQAELELG